MTRPEPSLDPASCPPLDALEELAAGRAVGGDVTRHVEACAACAAEIERIRRDNDFLSALIEIERRPAAGTPPPSPPLPPPPAPEPTPGLDLVPGYEILAQVYAGGQGIVYKAIQKATRRRVAVKVLSHVYAASPSRMRRFEREIEVVAALRHPNLVTVYDSGTTTDGRLFFAMEYVEGRTLDATRPQGRSDLEAALVLFGKIARAVDHAHRHGVIHRDLKPGNVLIDGAGEPRVVDFGLAKLAGPDADGGAALTIAGEFMGTLAYAAPEQFSGHPDRVDVRADVYALGVMLYEMLTGGLPYRLTGSVSDIIRTITQTPPQPPSAIAPAIDDDLEVIVLKALSKAPERRYRSAAALADDLDRCVLGHPIDARRDSTWYVLKKTLRRHRVPVALVTAAIVLVTAFAAVMSFQAHRIGHERDRADASAVELRRSLRESDFQRGRAFTAAGNIAPAEDLLWREFLEATPLPSKAHLLDAGAALAAPCIDVGGAPAAFWALWELHARTTCLATSVVADGAREGAVSGAVAISPDGQTLASGGHGVIRLLPIGAHQGQDPVVLRTDDDARYVAFAPDRRMLVSHAAGGNPRLWDLDRHPPTSESLELGGNARYGPVFAPDGGTLAIARLDGVIEVWDVSTRTRRVTLHGKAGRGQIAIGPDGLLACARPGAVDIWDLATATVVHVAHTDDPRVVSFSPDGRFVVFAGNENVYRWDAPFDHPPATRRRDRPWLRASAGTAGPPSIRPAGDLLALALVNNVIELWDVGAARRVRVLAGHRGAVSSVAFSRDGNLLASESRDGTARLWDVAPRRNELHVEGFTDSINAIAFSPDGSSLASVDGWGLNLRIRDLARGDDLVIARPHAGEAVVAVAYSPDGAMVASAGHDHVVRIWNAKSGQLVRKLTGHTGWVQTVCFGPDEHGALLASGSYNGTVRLWDTISGECLAVLDLASRAPQVRFSPDGTRLATCGAELLIWDVSARPAPADAAPAAWSPPIAHKLEGHTAQVRTIAWSPDGRWLASGSDDLTIRLWDAASGACLRTLEGHALHLFALAVSPDGRLIASADRGGELRLWDVDSGRHLVSLASGADVTSPILDVAFSPDGRTLAAGIGIGTVEPSIRLWDLTYYARHIAGNLEYQIGRLPESQRDADRIRELRAWAARVWAGG